MTTTRRVQVKICGLTEPEQAAACERLGADAIGVVFYPPSPRNVSVAQAQAIRAALCGRSKLVGVFVNREPEAVIETARWCGLDAVQLHGGESPEAVRTLRAAGLFVIKALKDSDFLPVAARYEAQAFLLELGKGILPGGNGQGWDWASTAEFGQHYPFLLAGGLTPENIGAVLQQTAPQGVDASSSLECAPGIKDLTLVKKFIDAVHAVQTAENLERIFA